MPKLTRREALALAGAASAAGVLASAGARAAPAPAPPPPKRTWATTPSREVIRNRYFPNYTLVNQDGKEVRLYDDLIRDKVVLMNFIYTSCGKICPRVTDNLVSVQRLLGNRVGHDIFMYSFTLDPRTDTPAVLKEYTRKHYVGPGWQFLTGVPADLERLRVKLGFVDPDPQRDKDLENHIGNVRYGNEPHQLWAACPGMSRPEYIVESLSWVEKPAPGYKKS
jgi:protein SCO1